MDLSPCQPLGKLNAFLTEESSSLPLPFSFDFCKSHHWINSLTPLFMVLGSSFWVLQQLPSAGPKPRRPENTKRSAFQVFCCLHRLSALFAQAKPRTRPASGITPLQHQCCPDVPAHKHQRLTGFPGLAATTFLMFLTTTRPLTLLTVHSTSPNASDSSWVTFRAGRLLVLLEGQR